MKPYGRNKAQKFPNKRDNHIHTNGLVNWWEVRDNIEPRKTMKHKAIKDEDVHLQPLMI